MVKKKSNNTSEKIPWYNTWYRKWWLWLTFLILVVIVPSLINYIFKIKAFYSVFEAEWTAGDLLGYYGTILGALATIIAVVLTIFYSSKIQKAAFIANNKKIMLDSIKETSINKLKQIYNMVLLIDFEEYCTGVKHRLHIRFKKTANPVSLFCQGEGGDFRRKYDPTLTRTNHPE